MTRKFWGFDEGALGVLQAVTMTLALVAPMVFLVIAVQQ